jgi:hypothetical protein
VVGYPESEIYVYIYCVHICTVQYIPEILVDPFEKRDKTSPATEAASPTLGPRGGRSKLGNKKIIKTIKVLSALFVDKKTYEKMK